MTVYSRITGTGSHLPPYRLSNADLVAQLAADGVESSDEWIVERTGIRARHFAADGVYSSDLAFEACKNALQAAGKRPQDIDLVIVATSTPDMVFPSTACILQHKLAQLDADAAGIAGAPAFDVQAVCAGFIYALSVADAMIRAGNARRALVVGSEVFSRLLDFKDRTTCVLFGDGAGAVVLEASGTPGILATDIHADGKHVGLLCVPGHVQNGQILGDPVLKMDGQGRVQTGGGRARGHGPHRAGQSGLDGSRPRLAGAAPSQYPHHPKHGQKTQTAHGKSRFNRSRSRQHLGRFHSAGAGRGCAFGADEARPVGHARRRGRRFRLGFGTFALLI
jgi:3-oxoacyl-[acyl-carrier-protein] synthase III